MVQTLCVAASATWQVTAVGCEGPGIMVVSGLAESEQPSAEYYPCTCISDTYHLSDGCKLAGKEEGWWWQKEAGWKSHGSAKASTPIPGNFSHHAQFVDG